MNIRLEIEGRMKMPYNTVSLIDRDRNGRIFDIVTIASKGHIEDTIR